MKTKFTKPARLNGAQLITELATAGVIVNFNPVLDADGSFWLDIDPNKVALATPVVAAHVGIDAHTGLPSVV